MLESKGRTGVRQTKQVTILHGRGAFHSTKTFENLETAAMVQKFPEKFSEILETVDFRNANHSTENSGNSGSKVEWKGNFREKAFSKIWVYLARFSSGLEILENAVPFATGSYQKFKPDVLVEWKGPMMYMYPWLFCTMTNCKGPISSHQCNLTL